MNGPARVAVFASGGGTNFQALLNRFNTGREAPARVDLLVAGRAGIGALSRAEAAGVPAAIIDATELGHDAAAARMLDELDRFGIDLIALAGYVKLVPVAVVEAFRDRVINIHPALLPSFGGKGMYGARVHAAVLASGARVTGATVHLVDEAYDQGRILAQWPVPVLPGDTPAKLGARVLRVEHLLYPAAIEFLARGGDIAAGADELSFDLVQAETPIPGSVRRLNG